MRRFGFVDAQGNLIGNTDSVAFERNNFLGVVGEDANVAEAEVNQDLGADAAFVLHHALASGFAIELTTLVQMNLRKSTGGGVRRGSAAGGARFDAKAAAGVMKIEQDAAILLGNGFKRTRHEFAAIASR